MQRYAHLLIILPVFLADRWTKALVTTDLASGERLPVLSWLSIVHWQNRGGVFGLMSRQDAAHYVFLIVPLVVIAGLVYYLVAFRLPLMTRLALTLVLAGALGNMYDRLFYGSVVDFILVSYKEYYWPAFNVADMSITFGIGLWLCLQISKGGKPGKGRRAARGG